MCGFTSSSYRANGGKNTEHSPRTNFDSLDIEIKHKNKPHSATDKAQICSQLHLLLTRYIKKCHRFHQENQTTRTFETPKLTFLVGLISPKTVV